MSRGPVYAFFVAVACTVLALPVRGQAVISARAGLVHFFEGEVTVAGQPLEARLGKFASIPEGADLRTAKGRAEVLLTPGVFLRVGDDSAVRMVNTALSDTRVELLAGSAIVDSPEPADGTSVTLVFKSWTVHQSGKGTYRIDSKPPRLRVGAGEARVSAAGSDAPVTVGKGMDLPFADVLVPEDSTADSRDSLNDWADGRAEAVATDDSIAAHIQDPAQLSGTDLPADAFTYFPMLGVYSPVSPLSSSYGSPGYYQPGLYSPLTAVMPGFYSVYLPGYTGRPLLWLPPIGGQRPSYLPPRIGTPGYGLGWRPTSPRPITSYPITIHPAAPAGGAHVGGAARVGHR